ncbi:MAG: DNA-directed RNA polymerase subunit omega [Microscillaceae bacterium]|nr:DNA-directed RNA polymerase subunit omega [Microscillaceae bacterium]MDW8461388.1 DNA-directed RNA polymerase subunit omega [Cytophagales bacterium]
MKVSKYRNYNSSLVTRDLEKLTEPTGNLYESVAIISRRARQIATKLKEELTTKLADFATAIDTLEEVHENKEQIEISRSYEKLPKPTTIATEEFLEGKLIVKKVEPETE